MIDKAYIPELRSSKKSGTDKQLVQEGRRLERALEVVAQLAVENHVYLPVFERLEEELDALRTLVANNPLNRARTLAQKIANR